MDAIGLGKLFAAGMMLMSATTLNAANTVGLKLEGTWLVTINANSLTS